jgi:hypothetical protein
MLVSYYPRLINEYRFMVDGIENDDGWMMVEDELLMTARQFTAHLHHAEYQRQKELARSRPTDRVARPPGGASDASTVLKRLAEGASSDAIDEMDNEELDPYNSDPLLAELMNGAEELDALVELQTKDADGDVAMEGVTSKPRRLATATKDGILEPGKKVVSIAALELGSGPVSGASSEQTPRRVGFDIGSPPRPRPNIIPAKLAAKLAKRKLGERKEDDANKADARTKDTGIGAVPTFLL